MKHSLTMTWLALVAALVAPAGATERKTWVDGERYQDCAVKSQRDAFEQTTSHYLACGPDDGGPHPFLAVSYPWSRPGFLVIVMGGGVDLVEFNDESIRVRFSHQDTPTEWDLVLRGRPALQKNDEFLAEAKRASWIKVASDDRVFTVPLKGFEAAFAELTRRAETHP